MGFDFKLFESIEMSVVGLVEPLGFGVSAVDGKGWHARAGP